ncbi:flavodoxin-dependent (E)-4-hydroxy-3-methylbut-2-enyl-diphosphate synthase [Anaerorhabdus sp.]|jgi:(E)-4-hydroxy-3-methylbut-2-enyl-diphosphate synthase|uniref:flavodoxin-dependent (E)-4-hydroxy-3-methylbut-2-enyl-diphosphate synthase n=1 Tax=Anaerorhabdus sp. TaxID=1872524 RepID=UPI002FC85971
MKRTETRILHVGNLQLGGQNKCLLQSMTNTKTKDVESTVKQIQELQDNGCEIVRMAILDEEDAYAIGDIKKQTNVPLVADIHFNYAFALIAIEQGIDKIRINPGNIGSKENVKKVVEKCKERNVPIRIGINSGSLEKEVLEKYGKPCPEAMIESAKKHVDILEELDFYDICLSFKSSNVGLTIDTYRLAAKTFPYPLHLGVTEAGSFKISSIKSSAALGALLHEGIGDTIRISVSSDPVQELFIGKQLLRAFDLMDSVPNLISCPTCGRIQYDMIPIVEEVELFLQSVHSNIEVAIMGCPVNGPQEASRADIGIAGGKNGALLFKKGQILKTVPQEDLLETLKEEILKMVNEEQ